MATNFPASQDDNTTLPNPSAANPTNNPSLSSGQSNQNDAIKAIEAKLGITASTPTLNNLLVGTGAGTSTWSKAAPTGTIVGTTDSQSLSNKTITGGTITGATITNATLTTDAVTGFTTANTGNVYGIPISAGVINSANTINGASLTSGSVATAAIANNAVTPAKRSGGFFIGTITAATTLATTGNKSITGVGFTPKMVRFTVIPTTSGTNSIIAFGAMTTLSQYTTAMQSASAQWFRYSSTAAAISWVNASTVPSLLATYVSMDADGFTINVTSAASNFDVAYEAYG